MNTQLVDSIVQIINALTPQEKQLLKSKLSLKTSELTTQKIMQLAENSQSFDFLNNEPNLYTFEDGEPI